MSGCLQAIKDRLAAANASVMAVDVKGRAADIRLGKYPFSVEVGIRSDAHGKRARERRAEQ